MRICVYLTIGDQVVVTDLHTFFNGSTASGRPVQHRFLDFTITFIYITLFRTPLGE